MERLSKRRLVRLLGDCGEGLVFKRKTTSTFDVKGGLVVAAAQSAGTGRLGRGFYSGAGGIYLGIKTANLPLLTINAAVGVMRALDSYGLTADVKWVNDIMLNGKKTCGILAKSASNPSTTLITPAVGNFSVRQDDVSDRNQESINIGEAVIGIGINYCVKRFPAEIADRAGSIFSTTKGINKFAALVIREVKKAITENNIDYYKSRVLGIGGNITLPDGNQATMTGIDNQGRLLYTTGGKAGKLDCGDIII